ncbi:MAG: MBG domain-containing protein, partial [Candidatus Poribacteria bacterium]|nr:MBG domain-containing protein [Candidatus Poribacteria bacterium]
MKHLQHKLTTSFKILLFVAVNFLSITPVNARPWRVEQIPNGNKFSCLNCHYSPYGGSRNSFGLMVESVVGRGSNDSFWNSVLAAKDSDGDGSSNGEELGDPDGDGKPTDGANITNPSDPESNPPKPVLVSAEVILAGLRQTYDGSAKLVTVTTGPAGLSVTVIYTDLDDGSAVASPTDAGEYSVVATVSDENYKGSARGTLKIVKGSEGGGGNKGKPEIVDIVIENDKIKLSVNFNEPFRWEKTRFESIKKFPQPWIGSPDTPHEIQLEEKGGMSWRQTDMVFIGNYRVLDEYEIEAAVSGYLLEIIGVFNP